MHIAPSRRCRQQWAATGLVARRVEPTPPAKSRGLPTRRRTGRISSFDLLSLALLRRVLANCRFHHRFANLCVAGAATKIARQPFLNFLPAGGGSFVPHVSR